MEMEEIAPPIPPGVDEAVEAELHPLENPAVLERLFELMPFKLKEFRNFRLVSRTWNKISLGAWRQNAWLTILDQSPYKKIGISRQKYLELLETNQEQLVQHPFRNCIIRKCTIDFKLANQKAEDYQIRFWSRVGPEIRKLSVHDCHFAEVEELRTMIFKTTTNLQRLDLHGNVYHSKRPATRAQRMDPKLVQHGLLPPEEVRSNLVEFNIDLRSAEVANNDEGGEVGLGFSSFPITWMELFLHFPNIKKIKHIHLGPEPDETELDEFFESVEILRKEHGPWFLADFNNLDLWGKVFGGIVLPTFNRLRLPLKRLCLEIDETVDEEKREKQLLQHPLEDLDLTREDRAAIPMRNFPFGVKFTALRELVLTGPFAPNLKFLKDCPNLEIFQYTYEGQLEADFIQVLGEENPSKLTSFNIHTGQCCSAQDIRVLEEFMPDLEILTIGLDNDSFEAVCEIFEDLTRLIIKPFRVDEEALLGKYVRNGKRFRRPNITDLQNLKVFSMNYLGETQQGLTEAGILEGILALPNLETVNSICLSSEVSAEVRKQFEMKFPKCVIYEEDVDFGEDESEEETEGEDESGSENEDAMLEAQFQ